MKKKIVLFGDVNSPISKILFRFFLLNKDSRFEIVAIVNTTSRVKTNKIKSFILFFIKKFFNPFDKDIRFIKSESYLDDISDENLILYAHNVNDSNFIKTIRNLNPDYALLMGCPQIFKTDLINSFKRVVNYHNSYLPRFRGLYATSWAMTYNEKFTGYTFHEVNEDIDDGRIILQNKILIDYSKSSWDNELLKTNKASNDILKVLELIFNDFKGVKQVGERSYYGKKEQKEILNYEKFNNIEEVRKVINVWGGVFLGNERNKIFVTKLSTKGKIKRIKWLPPKLYFFYKKLVSLSTNSTT